MNLINTYYFLKDGSVITALLLPMRWLSRSTLFKGTDLWLPLKSDDEFGTFPYPYWFHWLLASWDVNQGMFLWGIYSILFPISNVLFPLVLMSSIQFSSVAQSCLTLCDPMNRSTPGLPVHHQLPEFTQTHVHQIGDAIQPSHPLSSPSPPAPNPSQHQSLFQWVNSSQRWPKYWSFSFSIIPSKEIPGLISFRMDWLDLLVVQRTLKSLLQHQSPKASILRHSAFFTVQLSHPYMTTGKTIALTRRTFVGKVISLLFNVAI